ncbi:MAG: NUDIX domain-containing protein [Polyangiaceae bacterium]|nr:NUDIX domain-containing protein [Myxococcales bacterium]MCB9585602.1 NUDIX domain-containing protein [Polyangiaceae bacterium]MCB9606383.1 NUDIX domain-containing protein [Polyangiaceae bacterium]
MAKAQQVSAGILLWRPSLLFGGGDPQGNQEAAYEFLLAHPGGPYFKNKDEGAWSIPKGLLESGEDAEAAALREFREETGLDIELSLVSLGEVKLKSGKRVLGFAAQGDCDAASLQSNTFEVEWPPRSGRKQSFPEIDCFEWFGPQAAKVKLNPAQALFVDRALEHITAE